MNVTRRQLVRTTVALGLWGLMGCAHPKQAGSKQATTFNFDTVCVLGGVMSQEVLDEAVALCDEFERLFSRTLPTSDVGRLNASGGEAVEVDPRTAELVRLALGYCEESDGLFDITVGAVTELWDFAQGIIPGEEAVAQALPHVDWHNVKVSGDTVRLLDAQARIDLGGIAKGYMADQLVSLFEQRGVRSAFVNLGGNVKVLGSKANSTPWEVGVRDPADETGSSVVAKLSITGGSLVTSGLYERSFERDGRRYWHILDPRTGYPVETDVVSASIYSQASIDGDGYTKPLFMLGTDEALRFLEEHDGLEGLLFFANGDSAMTTGASFELV